MAMGRPPIDFDWHTLDTVLKHGLHLTDCSELLQVSEDTIARRIRDAHDLTFAEYRSKKMAHTRLKLMQKTMEGINNGNTALTIFALKNLCNWSDKNIEIQQVAKHKATIKRLDGSVVEYSIDTKDE